jgi:DNA-binding CsgD family transcriptional regulator
VAATVNGKTSDEDALSPRETEVLRLTALGVTSAEIARELRLSTRTVESHRMHIHRQLGLATRAELVRYALSRHLVGAPPGRRRRHGSQISARATSRVERQCLREQVGAPLVHARCTRRPSATGCRCCTNP